MQYQDQVQYSPHSLVNINIKINISQLLIQHQYQDQDILILISPTYININFLMKSYTRSISIAISKNLDIVKILSRSCQYQDILPIRASLFLYLHMPHSGYQSNWSVVPPKSISGIFKDV